ncbi:MAG: hypothetical protein J5I81_05455 [Nitrococcus mobilis]|nr:hypothetical protein [Nitrococcus mobilis]
METENALLTKILVAQVISLEKQIAAEKKARGTTRVGGDFIREAIELIHQSQPRVLEMLQRTLRR